MGEAKFRHRFQIDCAALAHPVSRQWKGYWQRNSTAN